MKRVFFLCVSMFVRVALFAQQDNQLFPGVSLILGADADCWSGRAGGFRSDNVTQRLPKGTMVLGDTQRDTFINGELARVTAIRYEGNEYYTQTDNLIPVSNGRLSSDWITVPWGTAPDAQKIWVVSYYLDILRSQDRNTFLKYEQAWVDWLIKRLMYEDDEWYESNPCDESLVFFDAAIFMGGLRRNTFFITDVVPFEAGYKITMSGDRLFALPTDFGGSPSMSLPFPPWSERRNLDMVFIPDGDYMDVYLDNLDNHFATFAKVDAVMLEDLNMLMRTNTVDLSNITFWPQRADGSTDYPPPEGANLAFRAGHKTIDRLRVRENPDTASAIVTTLDTGTHVQLLETGTTETIGGITAPWVKVQSENGFTGWAFSGYLEPLNPEQENTETQNPDLTNPEQQNLETQNPDSANPEPENVETQNLDSTNANPTNPEAANSENTKSSFPVLTFAITGGVILVAGIVTIAVLAKRIKGKATKP